MALSRRIFSSACLVAFACAAVAFATTEHGALLRALQARYEEKPGMRGFAAPGSSGPILTIGREGITARDPSQGGLISPINKIVNGKLEPLGSWSQASANNGGGRLLSVGEPVQVQRVEVKADAVKIDIVTCTSCQPGAGVYTAALLFPFAKGFLETARPEDIEPAIETFLAFPQARNEGPAPPSAETAQTAVPPAPAAPPATISLGQTIDQVVATLGQPLQIIDLGSKKTYKYKDLKVIFVNGKVADVQ